MLPVQYITLEELFKSDIEIYNNEIESWDELEYEYFELLEENIEISEMIHEYMMSETAYKAASHLNISTEGELWEKFKAGVKEGFSKILEFIKKVIAAIIRIITWPFRKIVELFKRMNMRKQAERVILAFADNGSTIKSRIPQSTNELVKLRPDLEKVIRQMKGELSDLDRFIDQFKIIVSKAYDAVENDEGQLISALKEFSETYIHPLSDKVIYDHFNKILLDVVNNIKAKDIKLSEYIGSFVELIQLSEQAAGIKKDNATVQSILHSIESKSEDMRKKLNPVDRNKNILSEDDRLAITGVLNHIRRRLVNVAQAGTNIFKYFNIIDKNFDTICQIAGYYKEFCDIDKYKGKKFDTVFSGIDVVCDDYEVLKHGGAKITTKYYKMNPPVSDEEFAKNVLGISNDGRYGTSNAQHGCIIVVSEGVKAWFDSKDPKKLKWYKAKINHEYGHTGHRHDFNGARELNEYEEYTNEINSDKAGIGLSETIMTKEEYLEYRAACTIEIVRLEKVKYNTIEEYDTILRTVEHINNEYGIRFQIVKNIFR